ncbi:uncharacterized protein FIBRA_02813 [Fibroporia radiculosa]|uniref:Thioester reductase (TE) domain-containing protein n=1 Tax=Fibroporia radiculosa TaxID=599839 RepID=J4HVJ0_9APHY|nr:uncharacterized protein FIBRA_02813 [Fibroporia radiculosa]CCM00772.1 predicted protein [Fibroporia radiculosa]
MAPESISDMHAMVAKYSVNLPVRPQTSVGRHMGDVVLVTGTTGSLGCYLLEALAAEPEVVRVYALNRASRDGVSLRARQRAALDERGVDASILGQEKVVLLEGDLTKPEWGLAPNVYEELHKTVTHIIHNAWRVNLLAHLPKFEANVKGLRSLIDFALTSPQPSPAHLLFVSSISVLFDAPLDGKVYEGAVPPAYAASAGYGASKWVAEEILYAAARTTPLAPLVARVGVICGGPSGSWSTDDWVPALAQSARPLGCFPDDPKAVDWIPFDIAARALVELRGVSNAAHTAHVVHTRPVPWSTLAAAAASVFATPLVPSTRWLAVLEAHARRTAPAPRLMAAHLLPFFERQIRRAERSALAFGLRDMDTARAREGSPTLADPALRQVGAEDVRRWIVYWEKVGLWDNVEQGEQTLSARL